MTVKEIGKIYEVECSCGGKFCVDAVGIEPSAEFVMEKDFNKKESYGMVSFTTITCPRCKKNLFPFIVKHAFIRDHHPLLREVTNELLKLQEWSK